MKEFEFSIVASGLDPQADDFESRFYDGGCDDATVAFQKGHIILDFARESASLEEAIATAVEAVTRAGATVERIEPDPLVNLSDMAERAGLTRAAISNYANGLRKGDFPKPVAKVTSASPLWDWSTVARWMYRHRQLSKDAALEAEIFRQANVAIGEGDMHLYERLKKSADDYARELQAA